MCGWGRAVFQPGMKRPWERSFRPEQAPNETPSIERGACGKPRRDIGSGRIPRRRGTACRGSGRRRRPPPRARHPRAPFGQGRCGQSLRASPQRGRMVAQRPPSRPEVWPAFRDRFGVRQRRKERAGSGIRQCVKAPSRCGDLIGRACAGHGPVQGQALLHCAALRCDRRRCTRPLWAVAVISRNHPSPKGAPQ